MAASPLPLRNTVSTPTRVLQRGRCCGEMRIGTLLAILTAWRHRGSTSGREGPLFAPYLELVLRAQETTDSRTSIFRDDIHWGYWAGPFRGQVSQTSYLKASDRLTNHVLSELSLYPGFCLLDVGCGFGGTLRMAHTQCPLGKYFGLNIDERQLAVGAKRSAESHAGKSGIFYVGGDACSIPLSDSSMDGIVALESAFHFGSRSAFLAEAGRVLRPGGRLVVADFLLDADASDPVGRLIARRSKARGGLFGPVDLSADILTYHDAASAAGLRLLYWYDITAQTLPTYRHIDALWRSELSGSYRRSLWSSYVLNRLGIVKYMLLVMGR